MGDFFRWEGDELVLNIGPLITRLDPIPTFDHVAKSTGLYTYSVEDLAMGNMKRIAFSYLWPLFKFFRESGLEIELGDLFSIDSGVSRLDENNDQRPETTPIQADRKRHDFVDMGAEIDAESVPLIERPIFLETNIVALKHLLIAKKGKIYLNTHIFHAIEVDFDIVGGLIRGQVTSFNLSTMGKLAYYFQNEGVVIEAGDFFCWDGNELLLNIGALMARLDPVPTYEEVRDEAARKRVDRHFFFAC